MQLIKSDGNMKDICKAEINNETLEVESISGDCGLQWSEEEESDYDFTTHTQVFTNCDQMKYLLMVESLDMDEACGECIEPEDPDDDPIPVWAMTLYLVPASVSKKIALECLGCDEDDDTWEWVQEDWEKHKDYRCIVKDIRQYGYGVPIWSESSEHRETLRDEAKKQAAPVSSLLGFYMDKPVNAIGWNGWKLLRDAKAYPGQHGTITPAAPVTGKCGSCWEDGLECAKYDTIYGEETLCEDCATSGYLSCTTCNILIPSAAQSWGGVDWVELEGLKYCGDCADKIIDSPQCPNIIVGGTELTPEDLKGKSVPLYKYQAVETDEECPPLLDEWTLVATYTFRMGDLECVELNASKEICLIIKKNQPDREYLVGPIEYAQFGMALGLLERKRPEGEPNV